MITRKLLMSVARGFLDARCLSNRRGRARRIKRLGAKTLRRYLRKHME